MPIGPPRVRSDLHPKIPLTKYEVAPARVKRDVEIGVSLTNDRRDEVRALRQSLWMHIPEMAFGALELKPSIGVTAHASRCLKRETLMLVQATLRSL